MDNIVINITEVDENYNIDSITSVENVDITSIYTIDNVTVNSQSNPIQVDIDTFPQIENVRINVIGSDYTSPNSKNPQFTYNSGILTRIDYSDLSYKTFSYSGTFLSQVIHFLTNYTITKNFSYSSDQLSSITEVIG